MTERAFFIVWSPSGRTPPTVKHRTFDDARREAVRLADVAPGTEFYVLEASLKAQKMNVVTEMLEGFSGEIPF